MKFLKLLDLFCADRSRPAPAPPPSSASLPGRCAAPIPRTLARAHTRTHMRTRARTARTSAPTCFVLSGVGVRCFAGMGRAVYPQHGVACSAGLANTKIRMHNTRRGVPPPCSCSNWTPRVKVCPVIRRDRELRKQERQRVRKWGCLFLTHKITENRARPRAHAHVHAHP